jgi:hypothetical protein
MRRVEGDIVFANEMSEKDVKAIPVWVQDDQTMIVTSERLNVLDYDSVDHREMEKIGTIVRRLDKKAKSLPGTEVVEVSMGDDRYWYALVEPKNKRK